MTTITYERVPRTITRYVGGKNVPSRTVYDYKVLIDGEHRATFTNNGRYGRAGFTLDNGTGEGLASKRYEFDPITRIDFDDVVREYLPKIATVAEIERVRAIIEAEKENIGFDETAARYKTAVHRHMLSDALTQYLDNVDDGSEPSEFERDKLAAARKMLDRINYEIAEKGT